MSGSNEWIDYALSMADSANASGRDFTLVANRLEGLSLVTEVEERLHRIALRNSNMSDVEAARATRGLFGELTRWLLEFMIAASYVRREQGLTEAELSFAVGRWFSRLGEALSDSSRTSITYAILVKALLNDARPFMVACTTSEGVSMVEAPLLIRVEHGRYYVTDETENYLYHFDSIIDEFATGYSLIATRMGRELDSRSYGKSSRTVNEMISRVGHVRRQMNALVEDTGHLDSDEQWERYESIRRSVDAIREHREAVQRYRQEVTWIREGWSNYDVMDRMRETRGERLSDLRSLEEGLRVLAAVESWMYDEYAGLSDRCAEVTRHYLHSNIVTTLFSLDDLIDEVVRTDICDLEWLDALLLPVTSPNPAIDFEMPPLVLIDEMTRSTRSIEEAPSVDYESLADDRDEEAIASEDQSVMELAQRFASWLRSGGGSLADWIAHQSSEDVFADMKTHDLTRLVGSFLIGGAVGRTTLLTSMQASHETAPVSSFADSSWINEVLPHGREKTYIHVSVLDDTVAYEGAKDGAAIRGMLDNVQFEVSHDA